MKFGGAARETFMPDREDLAKRLPAGDGLLDWLCEPEQLQLIGSPIACQLTIEQKQEGPIRTLAAETRRGISEAGGALLLGATLGAALPQDVRELAAAAAAQDAPYAVVLVAAHISRAMRDRIVGLNDAGNLQAAKHYGFELLVSDYVLRMHLVAGHACVPESLSKLVREKQLRFWTETAIDLSLRGHADAYAHEDGSGLTIPLGWLQDTVCVRVGLLHNKLAAYMRVSRAGSASAQLFDELAAKHDDIASASPLLGSLQAEKFVRMGRLVVPIGRPANLAKIETWMRFRAKMIDTAVDLAAAVKPHMKGHKHNRGGSHRW